MTNLACSVTIQWPRTDKSSAEFFSFVFSIGSIGPHYVDWTLSDSPAFSLPKRCDYRCMLLHPVLIAVSVCLVGGARPAQHKAAALCLSRRFSPLNYQASPLLKFFEHEDETDIYFFPWTTPLTTIVKHWFGKLALGKSWFYFWRNSTQNYKANSFFVEAYTLVKSFQQLMLFELQGTSNYLYFLYCQKLRQERSWLSQEDCVFKASLDYTARPCWGKKVPGWELHRRRHNGHMRYSRHCSSSTF